MPETLIFCIANQKGGVGKTTTAISLAAALGQKKYKTLLIDLDAQGNSSSIFINKADIEYSSYSIFKDKLPLSQIVKKTRIEHLDIIASQISLSEVETLLAGAVDGFFRLRDSLSQNTDVFYDTVIIDCPPNLGLLTVNAFVCAHHLIIPLPAAKFSMDGLVSMLDTQRTIQKRFNPHFKTLGALVTLYNSRTSITKAILDPIEKYVPLFSTRISRSVIIEEAHLMGQTIFEYQPTSKVALEYNQFCEELLNEIQKG